MSGAMSQGNETASQNLHRGERGVRGDTRRQAKDGAQFRNGSKKLLRRETAQQFRERVRNR
jgi:hypothetical protein